MALFPQFEFSRRGWTHKLFCDHFHYCCKSRIWSNSKFLLMNFTLISKLNYTSRRVIHSRTEGIFLKCPSYRQKVEAHDSIHCTTVPECSHHKQKKDSISHWPISWDPSLPSLSWNTSLMFNAKIWMLASWFSDNDSWHKALLYPIDGTHKTLKTKL